jgi:hypothetical protein
VLSNSFNSVIKPHIDLLTNGFVGSKKPSSPPSAHDRCGYDLAIFEFPIISSSPGVIIPITALYLRFLLLVVGELVALSLLSTLLEILLPLA